MKRDIVRVIGHPELRVDTFDPLDGLSVFLNLVPPSLFSSSFFTLSVTTSFLSRSFFLWFDSHSARFPLLTGCFSRKSFWSFFSSPKIKTVFESDKVYMTQITYLTVIPDGSFLYQPEQRPDLFFFLLQRRHQFVV